MSEPLEFGRLRWELEFPAEIETLRSDAPRGVPIEDARSELTTAMGAPLEFPPLAQAVAPGDRVAIVLDADVPQAAQLVQSVVQMLTSNGVSLEEITVLLPELPGVSTEEATKETTADDAQPAQLAVPAGEFPEGIEFLRHDSHDRRQLSLLATTRANKALYLNRILVDADLVLPIGRALPEGPSEPRDLQSGWFPAFSDEATLQRLRRLALGSRETSPVEEERSEAVRLLGILAAIETVPAGNHQLMHVLAGEWELAHQQAQQLYRNVWQFDCPGTVDLVVASIDGEDQQSWENIARAIWNCRHVLEPGGAMVICSELAESPGPALRQLQAAESPATAVNNIRKFDTSDALAAWRIASTLGEHRIYLVSGLEDDVVESLQMFPLHDAAEVSRLAALHKRCLVVPHAQFACPRAAASE